MQKAENLVVVSEENLTHNAFPLKLEPVIAQRSAANEAKHRHLTSLIVPILVAADNKIMVINKYKKNIAKCSNKIFPPKCYDILGGHAVRESIPENELEKGEISEESVAVQAFREFSEEMYGPQTFDVSDLHFLGFYPYPQPGGQGPVPNKEYTAVFAILLTQEEASYAAQDNVGEDTIHLDCKGFSYTELLHKWNEREINKEVYYIEDGLGRILAKGDLPARIRELRLPGKNGPITIL